MYYKSLRANLVSCENGKLSHFCSNSLLLEISTDRSGGEYAFVEPHIPTFIELCEMDPSDAVYKYVFSYRCSLS